MKKEYNRIIVPIDGSEQSKKAAEKACFFAKSTGIELLALHVINIPDLPSEFEHADEITYKQIYELLKKEGNNYFEEIKKIAKKYDVHLSTTILEGHPHNEIIKEAKKNDIIIMGHKGRSGLDHLLLGSTTEKVIRHTDSDIMIIR